MSPAECIPARCDAAGGDAIRAIGAIKLMRAIRAKKAIKPMKAIRAINYNQANRY